MQKITWFCAVSLLTEPLHIDVAACRYPRYSRHQNQRMYSLGPMSFVFSGKPQRRTPCALRLTFFGGSRFSPELYVFEFSSWLTFSQTFFLLAGKLVKLKLVGEIFCSCVATCISQLTILIKDLNKL